MHFQTAKLAKDINIKSTFRSVSFKDDESGAILFWILKTSLPFCKVGPCLPAPLYDDSHARCDQPPGNEL